MNETFKIRSRHDFHFRFLQNPRNRIKRISNLSPTNNHEQGVINARNFARDHRDTIIFKKVPRGYKLIGIRAMKNTFNDQVLHFTDFLIWKVPENWPVKKAFKSTPRQDHPISPKRHFKHTHSIFFEQRKDLHSKYEVDSRQQKVPNLLFERVGMSDVSSFTQLMTTKREERTVNFRMDT